MTLSQRIRWVASTTVGLALVGFAFHFPGGSTIGGGIDAWQPEAVVFGAFLGVLSGIVVGLIQWVALRGVLARPWFFVGAMAAGIGVTHALADGAPASLGRAAVALAGGLVLGGALALAERRPLALGAVIVAWAGGIVLAYAVTGALGLPATQDPVGWGTEHAVVGAITGLPWGIATAWAGLPISARTMRAP